MEISDIFFISHWHTKNTGNRGLEQTALKKTFPLNSPEHLLYKNLDYCPFLSHQKRFLCRTLRLRSPPQRSEPGASTQGDVTVATISRCLIHAVDSLLTPETEQRVASDGRRGFGCGDAVQVAGSDAKVPTVIIPSACFLPSLSSFSPADPALCHPPLCFL